MIPVPTQVRPFYPVSLPAWKIAKTAMLSFCRPEFNESFGQFPPYLDRQPPSESLGPVCASLKTFYADCQLVAPGDAKVVCNFSHNWFQLEDALYLGKWLKENDVHLWALDLSSNCIHCRSAQELEDLVNTLMPQAEWLNLGGNELPGYRTSSAQLSAIQSDGHVSLALLVDSLGAPDAAAESAWRRIAVRFDRNAYGFEKGYVSASSNS